MPVKFVLSEGGAADCLFAEALIADIATTYKKYTTHPINDFA